MGHQAVKAEFNSRHSQSVHEAEDSDFDPAHSVPTDDMKISSQADSEDRGKRHDNRKKTVDEPALRFIEGFGV